MSTEQKRRIVPDDFERPPLTTEDEALGLSMKTLDTIKAVRTQLNDAAVDAALTAEFWAVHSEEVLLVGAVTVLASLTNALLLLEEVNTKYLLATEA